MAYYRTGPDILREIANKFTGTCYVSFVSNVGDSIGKIPSPFTPLEIEFNEPKEEVINGIRGFKLTSKNKVVFPKPGISLPGITHIQIFSTDSGSPSESDLLASMPVLGYDSSITIAPNEERVIEEIEIDLW